MSTYRHPDPAEPGSSYNTIIAPTVNFLARWLSRVRFLAGVALLLAVAAGWTR